MTAASLIVRPGNVPGRHLAVPGDKSISHRALILAALAEGETVIHGLLESADCLATAAALGDLGIRVERNEREYRIKGGSLRAASTPIDCGNSGTAMRLLAGVLAGQSFESVLVGDESLSRRPMRRIAEPLALMGGVVEISPDGTPPLRIMGRSPLRAIDYRLPVPSAQVKSAILLAGLFAKGKTRVTEAGVSRDHTERMLRAFGADVGREGDTIVLSPTPLRSPGSVDVPGDLSSAAFPLVLAAISPACRIQLEHVGINPTRDGVLRLLQRMGANLEIRNRHETRDGEPVADLIAEPSELRGIEVDDVDVALAIDEIPVLLIAAACAAGTTTVRGAAELRVKETDRLTAMAAGLRALGITVEEFDDGIAVTGGYLHGGVVDSRGDHRIAMAFAIAATVAGGPVTIMNTQNIGTSYPDFRADMVQLGMDIEESRQ